MDGVESASAPPQVPPPLPRTTSPQPALRFSDFVVFAVLFGIVASVWLSSAANAAYVAAQWGYGEGSIPAAFAKDSVVATSMVLGLFLHATVLIVLRQESGGSRAGPQEVGGGSGTAAQPRRGIQDLIRRTIIVILIMVVVILAVGILMGIISYLKAARGESSDYMVLEIVIFIGSISFCLFTYPLVIIRLVYQTREV